MPGGFHNRDISSKAIADFLEDFCGIPAIDQIGLTGRYDIHLQWDYKNDSHYVNLKQALFYQHWMHIWTMNRGAEHRSVRTI